MNPLRVSLRCTRVPLLLRKMGRVWCAFLFSGSPLRGNDGEIPRRLDARWLGPQPEAVGLIYLGTSPDDQNGGDSSG